MDAPDYFQIEPNGRPVGIKAGFVELISIHDSPSLVLISDLSRYENKTFCTHPTGGDGPGEVNEQGRSEILVS